MNNFKRWASLAGFFLCGSSAAAGLYLGRLVGHGRAGAVIGGAVGGYLLVVVLSYVAQRYSVPSE